MQHGMRVMVDDGIGRDREDFLSFGRMQVVAAYVLVLVLLLLLLIHEVRDVHRDFVFGHLNRGHGSSPRFSRCSGEPNVSMSVP